VRNTLIGQGIAEFIGTFMLIFVGAGAVTVFSRGGIDAALVVAALAHGLILIAIIATFGSISGAAVNPAITFGLLLGGKINGLKALVFWAAQFAGGILGAFVITLAIPDIARVNGVQQIGQTVPTANITTLQILLIEGLLTFFLTSTVYQTAIYGRGPVPAGVAIGFTLAACILLGGAITGASLNPARTLGPGLISGDMNQIGIYLAAQFIGGAVAGVLHGYIFGFSSGK